MYPVPLAGLGECVVAGMGQERARRAAQLLADRGARQLVSWGLAGALCPDLASGQLLCPAGVVDAQGRRYPVTTELQAHCLEQVCLGAVTADLVTWHETLVEPEQKQALYRRTGARAVDMESVAIAQVARERNLEFVVLRALFDPADRILPASILANTDPWGAVRFGGLVAALLRRPSDLLRLPGLARLARRSRQSLKAMADALPALNQGDNVNKEPNPL